MVATGLFKWQESLWQAGPFRLPFSSSSFIMFGKLKPSKPYFGLRGGWLTFWVTVACATDMMLFGYDQGVFGIFPIIDSNTWC